MRLDISSPTGGTGALCKVWVFGMRRHATFDAAQLLTCCSAERLVKGVAQFEASAVSSRSLRRCRARRCSL